jgi:hypothetical protein
MALSAMLPGGDPLAAALADGVTPSPEVVAEAGGCGSHAGQIAMNMLKQTAKNLT